MWPICFTIGKLYCKILSLDGLPQSLQRRSQRVTVATTFDIENLSIFRLIIVSLLLAERISKEKSYLFRRSCGL